MTNAPRVRAGQKINLIQVTGNVSISGFVDIDLYFHMAEGPVKLSVEAYVVKGMSTPFILGNDFADQFSISVMRNEGKSHLLFGDSSRQMQVDNSTSPSMLDEDGHAFKVNVTPVAPGIKLQRALHRKKLKKHKYNLAKSRDPYVRSAAKMFVAPGTSVAIPVTANLPKNQDSLYVEKVISSYKNEEEVYAPPDSLISKDRLKLHVANFSDRPVTIQVGEILGIGHNPNSWLDRMEHYTPTQRHKIAAHATFVKNLVQQRLDQDESSANTVSSQAWNYFRGSRLQAWRRMVLRNRLKEDPRFLLPQRIQF